MSLAANRTIIKFCNEQMGSAGVEIYWYFRIYWYTSISGLFTGHQAMQATNFGGMWQFVSLSSCGNFFFSE